MDRLDEVVLRNVREAAAHNREQLARLTQLEHDLVELQQQNAKRKEQAHD